MKTKNLLVLILVLGLSFNAFSQEKITIKQTIKSSDKSSNESSIISAIDINTDSPVRIKSGKENIVYLTGYIDNPNDYKGFCVLKDEVLKINSPSQTQKDFNITIELQKEVYLVCLGENSKVDIDNGVLSGGKVYVNSLKNSEANFNGDMKIGELTFLLLENSKATFSGLAELGRANIIVGENSEIKFWNIDGDYAKVVADKGAVIDFIGNIDTVDMKMHKDSDIKGDYTWTEHLFFRIDSTYVTDVSKKFRIINEDGIMIQSKEDSIYLNNEYKTHVKAIGFSKELIEEKKKEEKASIDIKKKGINPNFGLQFGYGILGWSNKVSNVDGLFASPQDQYSLRYGNSWTLGFRYWINLSRRWSITTGIGYESNIFRFDNNVKLTDIGGEKRIAYETDPTVNAKTKLVARYVTLPLFLSFNVVEKLNIHIGAIAGVNFRSSSTGFKRNFDDPKGEVKERWGTKYDNFKPLKLDLQAGFGWKGINFYVKYALTPLFKDNREITVYPFSVGLSLGL
ncbi:MAG: outer membrane beta-barrel protein [Bacteroidales bacterium]